MITGRSGSWIGRDLSQERQYIHAGKNEERMVRTMNNLNAKIEELLTVLKKKEDDKQKNTFLWVLAIIGADAAVTAIAFAVYRFFAPDYLEDFEEDFDDDFDDYFEDEEE